MQKYIYLLVFNIGLGLIGFAQGITEDEAPKLFKQMVVHEFRIEVKGDAHTILTNTFEDEALDKPYTEAMVVVDGVQYPKAGVRYKGQSSYDFTPGRKKSLKIEFDQFADKSEKHKGYDKINLLNNFKDPTMLREILYLDMLRKAGVPAPKAAFAKVYLNGEYLGIYTMTEQINDDFCDRVFGNDDGNLYKGQPRPSLEWKGEELRAYKSAYMLKEKGDREEWSDLVELVMAIDNPVGAPMSDQEFVDRLEGILNTKDMLKTWAVNNFFMNIDAYNMFYQHNFYLYNNPMTSKWEWINYDGNYTFASWNPRYSLEQCTSLDILYNNEQYPNSLVSKMFASPFYKKMYLDQYYAMVQWFQYGKWKKRVEKYAALIQEDVYADKHKATSNEDFNKGRSLHKGDILDPGAYIPGIYPFIEARLVSVRQQLTDLGYKF